MLEHRREAFEDGAGMRLIGVRVALVTAVVVVAALAGGPVAFASTARAPGRASDDGPAEGCSAAYWHAHQGNWQEYRPSYRVSDAWHMTNLPLAERRLTFAQALADPGRTATASRLLLRSAVAAYLNAAHEGVRYAYRRFDWPYYLHDSINAAIASNDPRYMRSVTRDLDRENDHRHCPLH